ncbi:MAG: alpha/beta hydrolase, partial [Cytophagales bacterium]|nr:alpha/beta hydrolase [Cytophagales bacterium]
VVLIHGWPLSNAMYEYQYQELAEAGFRAIGISMRGFGKSDKPYGRYTYDVFADDIRAVLDQLEIEEATLGGFSMGGAIATHYVARHQSARVNKLALFAAASPRWTSSSDYPYGLFTEGEVSEMIGLSKTNRAALYQTFGSLFPASPTSLPAGLDAWLGGINWEASPYAATQCLIALRDEDLRAELAEINVPVAIFHGVHDKIVPFATGQQALQGIPNAYLVPFEHSGHGLFVEEREKFNRELIRFVGQPL